MISGSRKEVAHQKVVGQLELLGQIPLLGDTAHPHTVPVRTSAALEKGLAGWRECAL